MWGTSKVRIIYDIGSNNGDDISYYLIKSDLVVAVEANPVLVDLIKNRFHHEILHGKLIIENVVITTANASTVDFYIHKTLHVLSQFGQPNENEIDNFHKVRLPSKSLVDIISAYGSPFYIKIDVEGYDQEILRHLFQNKIFPPYLSAESHNIDVFSQLVANGHYNAFKLVDGPSVATVYASHLVATMNGLVEHHFPDHSAGPFGSDIPGPWESAKTFFQSLANAGLGWKDIHVSNVELPER